MSDNHQINLNINAAGAKRGADTYKAAIRQITSATKAYKASVDALGGTKSSSTPFAKMAKDLNTLSGIKINSSLAKNVAGLAASMRGFRAPSSAQVKSTRDFLRAIATAQIKPGVARNVQGVSRAFSGFKGPSKTSTSSIRSLLRTLSTSKLNPSTARNLAAITASLSGFRGPSASAVRNIDSMVNSLNRLRRPPNMAAIAASLTAIASAGTRAQRSMNNLNAGQRGVSNSFRTTGSSALRLTGNMRGLENAMSLSYQAGSQLRVLFGSLTLAEFTRGVYNATLAMQRFQTTIGVTSVNLSEANSQMNFAAGVADKYGISLTGVLTEYGKFSTAARLAGQETENVKYIFESVSSAMRVMGTDTMGQSRVFRALTQIFSKGAVRAEELVQQLGEQIPGAFQLMEDALSDQLGKKIDLAKMLELGQVDDSAVVLFAKKLSEKFGPQVASAMERADSWVGRLQNSWTKFQIAVGEGGVQDAIGDVARKLSEMMEGDDFQSKAVAVADALGKVIRGIGDAAIWVIVHIKELGAAIAAMIAAKTISMIAGIATGMASVAASAGIVGMAFAALPLAIGAAVGALAYYWNTQLDVNNSTIGMGDVARQTFSDIKGYIFDTNGAVASFSLQGIMDWMFLADTATANGFNNMAKNGALTRDKFVELFSSMGVIIGAAVVKGFLQAGGALNKLIAYAARNIEYLTSFITDPLQGKANRLAEYNAALKGDFDALNKTVDSLSDGVDKLFGVDNAKMNVADLASAGLEELKQRAKEMKTVRDATAAQEAADREAAEKARRKDNDMLTKAPDTSGIDPLKKGSESSAGSKDSVSKRLKDAAKATLNYKMEVTALQAALEKGDITLNQYNSGLEFQARKLQETADPYAAIVRGMKDEMSIQGMATRAREIEIAHREKINTLAEAGVHVTAAQSKELRKLIETQKKMDNRPLKDWMDGIEDIGVATDKVAVTAMEGLSDQIADLVVDGKADFASLAKSILKEFIKIGVNQVYKSLFGDLFGGASKAVQTNVATPARDLYDTRQTELGKKAEEWTLRGASGPSGNTVEQEKVAQGLRDLDQSAMTLRGTLDMNGNASKASADAIKQLESNTSSSSQAMKAMDTATVSAAPKVDSLATAATNAASALDQISTSSTSPNQAYPGDRTGSASGANTAVVDTAAKGFNPNGNVLTLSPREITDLKKTLATEAAAHLKGGAYDSQASGITDTILNRKVSGQWGNSVTDVVNSRKQFSDINGPVSWKDGRYGVSDLPDSMLDSGRGKKASDFVDQYLEKRMGGQASSVGGHLNYANPAYSDKKNMEWINKLDGPRLGAGDSTHQHGTTAGYKPVDPNYSIQSSGVQSAGVNVDPQTTGSIQQVNQNLQQLGQTAQTTAQQTQTATQQEQAASQTSTMTSQQKAIADQQAGAAIQQAGQQAQQAAPGFQQAGQSIAQAGQTAQTAQPGLQSMGGGIQSLMGPLSSVVPGLGQFGGAIMSLLGELGKGGGGGGGLGGIFSALLGSFSEGGISTDPVAFRRLPQYAEGTSNTGSMGSGGIPSVLHPNEAVIPLSRGRKVPVEMNTPKADGSAQSEFQSSRSGGSNTFNLNLSGIKSADDFKRSQRQINQKLASAQDRTKRRNN